MKKPIGLSVTVITLLLLSFLSPLWAEEAGEKSAEEVLKERAEFNKLRRSTRNISKVTMRSKVVYRLQTALGIVTTIDLPEPALKVYAGDQDLFKVEVYHRQVLIKPITDDLEARSNLVIITESGRLAFDLSVGSPETADFILDFRLPHEDEALVENAFEKRVKAKVDELEASYQKEAENLNAKAEALSEERLREKIASGVSTIPLNAEGKAGEIEVHLLTLSRVGEKTYLRFSIVNRSETPYQVLKASVGVIQEQGSFMGRRETGLIEIPSELTLPEVIEPRGKVAYGVLTFDLRPLGKDEKPVFRILEDGGSRTIEIEGFRWVR